MQKRTILMLGLVLALTVLLVGATSVFAQEDGCSDCHNDTAVISGKTFPWETSMHASGRGWTYAGARGSCTACHSGASFQAMVAAGVGPNEFDTVTAVTPPDCRACHQVHTTYTGADWALETTDPVALYAFEDVTYDGGKGNLCANCHQPRRVIAAEDGIVNWSSSHYGPHHGPQTAMLMGLGGAGEVVGEAGAHYTMVADTCVTCHLGEGDSHFFAPEMVSCTGCHADAEDFDINGVQTEVEEKLHALHEALVAKGMLDEEGHSVPGEYPEAEANALWNYIFIADEDSSLGVHNHAYTHALLDASLAALGE